MARNISTIGNDCIYQFRVVDLTVFYRFGHPPVIRVSHVSPLPDEID